MSSSQKMQIRSTLMSVLNKYRDKNKAITADEFKSDLEKLSELSDLRYVCKTLFKEITDIKSSFSNTCAIFALELIPKDILKEEVIDFIKDEKKQNDVKLYLLSLLKQKGENLDIQEAMYYIDDSEKIAQNGVRDFLKNAIYDPEVQIDFLDFYLNVSKNERNYLLNSVFEEADVDDAANIFSLLVQIETEKNDFDFILSKLCALNSPYSLDGLNYVIKNCELDNKQKLKINSLIKEISFEYKDFNNFDIIKDSVPYQSYMGFVDGRGCFSLVFSRKRKNNSIDAFLLTINVVDGIVSTMGFGDILETNFNTIVKRLFIETIPIQISPMALRGFVDFFYNKNLKNKIEVPYEFVVWKKLLLDIKPINYDFSEFLTSKLDIATMNDVKIKKILNAKILETWYFSIGDNVEVDNLIKLIDDKHLIKLDEIDEILLDFVNNHLMKDENFIKKIKNMLIIQSYAANQAKLKTSSAYAFSLCFSDKLISILLHSILSKSFYYYLSTCLYEKEEQQKDNIFKPNLISNYTKEEIEDIMKSLEEKWS